MRRTERLFAIIQMLRARRAPVTARQLADELEVSLRTIYRDTAELVVQRVPLRGDASLARDARSLIEKLGQVAPKDLRPVLLDAALRPAPQRAAVVDGVDIGPIRRAIRDRRKVEIRYADAGRKETTRVVWPFLVAFMDEVRVVVAHCKLRDGFRHSRTDRIRGVRTLDVKYTESQRSLMKRWEEAFLSRA